MEISAAKSDPGDVETEPFIVSFRRRDGAQVEGQIFAFFSMKTKQNIPDELHPVKQNVELINKSR